MDAIEQQRKQLLEEIQTLPADVLQEVSNFIERLRQKAESGETLAAKTGETETTLGKEVANPYQELKEFGLIGFAEGPSDLSVNYKKYLAEGWGRSI
jgi:predicted  nucleic acid-binding Zn-ribbon protein